MRPYFLWGGVDSRTKNIVVNEYPPRMIPKSKTKDIVIPGRAGSLTLTEGDDVYEPYLQEIKCTVLPEGSIETVGTWLRGAGALVLGNDENRSVKARIDDEIMFDRIMKNYLHRSFTIPFVCQPGRYVYPAVADIVKTTSGTFITNPGTMHSQPKITVVATGDITLTVGTAIMLIDGAATQWTMVIDSELMDCFDSTMTVMKNDSVTGDLPTLQTGASVVSWAGNVTSVTIKPRWRYL